MVIAATTWPAASTREAAPLPNGHDPERLGGGGSTEAALAFAALLEATRVSVGTDQQSLASQMFEPIIRDAHQGRQNALKEEYRAGSLSPQGDGRPDATSVQARRALRESHSSDTIRHRSAGPGSPITARGEGQKPSPSTGESPSLMEKGVLRGRVASSPSEGGVHRTEATRSGSTSGLQVASPAAVSAEAAPVQPQVVGAPTAAASAAAPVQSSGPAGGSVAHQVAQILGTGRAGEVDSAKAPASSSPPEQARSTPQDQKTADKAKPNERSASKAPARPLDDTKVTTRSAFDRLVRSIRLRTSAQRSSARLHLHPPELGRMLVNVRMAGDELHIDVRTETAEARELLYERVARLRAMLELHGIHVGRFEVTGDLPTNHSDTPATADGFQRAGGDGRAYRRKDFSPWADREIRNDAGTPDWWDGDLEAAVVGERRLDVRI